MSHKELSKVRVFAYRKTVAALLEALQGYGAFHPLKLEEPYEGTEVHSSSELKTARSEKETLERAIELLEPYRDKGSFLDEMLPQKTELKEDDKKRLLKGNRPIKLAQEIIELEQERQGYEKEHESLLSQADDLIPWRSLDVTRSKLSKASRVRFETGVISAQAIPSLQAALDKAGSRWDFHTIKNPEAAGQIPVVFTCLASEASTYLPILNEAGFQELRLPREFPPRKEEERLRDKARQALLEANQRKKRIAGKAKDIAALRLAYDEAICSINRLEGEERAVATRSTMVLEGWVPSADFPELKHRVESLSTAFIEKVKPKPDEEPPVALQNNAFASPFEVVTDLFNRPRPDEFDPTPFLAPFFAIYFGICLTDAGYGLVLLLACYLLIRRLKPSGASYKLLLSLGICGAATVVLGLLTGGLFGILNSPEADAAIPMVRKVLEPIQWYDPMADQMYFFKLVLLFGIFQVAFGFALKGWANLKEEKVADAFFDQASWLLIIGGAFTLSLGAVGTIGSGHARFIGGGMMILGGLIVLLFSGREQENLFVRFAAGLYGLYGVTGIFGDVLSYARLLALGIATGVIAGVVNTVAAMCLDIPYGIGIAMFIVVLVFGHLANIAMNCMGAFVHTMRLQFVEFFTKFYEGGGEPFRPLAEEREYTIVQRRKTRP